jgi:hypothetical protein
VERGSAGDYTCQASSSEGSITHATQLLVLGALWWKGRGTGPPIVEDMISTGVRVG